MERGFAAFNSRVNWVSEVGVLDPAPIKGVTVVPMPLARTAHIPGYRCASCSILLLGYASTAPEQVVKPRPSRARR
jgi:hypothetical protein